MNSVPVDQFLCKPYIVVQVEALTGIKSKLVAGNVLFLAKINGCCFQDRRSTATRCNQFTSKQLVVQCHVSALVSVASRLPRLGSSSWAWDS